MRTPRNEAPWAVVPVKALDDAKQRLADVLPPEARRRLMLVMLHDVLATLRQVACLGPVLVVTPDMHVAELAQRSGARVLREACGQGHSVAVAAGFAHARAHGAVQALTLPGDAPCVTCGEIEHLIDAGDRIAAPGVVMVPARDGDGTNALLVAPPDAFPPRFGPGSFARHRAEAAARRLDCRTLPLAGIGLDIDEPRDLQALLALKCDDPRYAFLQDATSAEEIRP
jgi:2-phospho-L-lactate guanylyltransferase